MYLLYKNINKYKCARQADVCLIARCGKTNSFHNLVFQIVFGMQIEKDNYSLVPRVEPGSPGSMPSALLHGHKQY